MLKKLSSLFVIVLLLLVVCGCSKEEKSSTTESNDKIDVIDEVSSNKGTLNCTRSASVTDGSGSYNYTIKYKNGIILYIKSVESVTIDNADSLKEFEDAYKSIKANYKNIKNYGAYINKEGNTVSYTTIIDYNKVDTKALIELEGEEDNIYEDGKPMLEKWLTLAKKFGVTCSEE